MNYLIKPEDMSDEAKKELRSQAVKSCVESLGNNGEVFLGVVNRTGGIDIPWRGTTVLPLVGTYEPEQNLLVTLDTTTPGIATVVKIELPTLQQLKDIKDETAEDWQRFTHIFNLSNMRLRVLMLKALDRLMRNEKEY
jgi:hypothetical protein